MDHYFYSQFYLNLCYLTHFKKTVFKIKFDTQIHYYGTNMNFTLY
jgi:hypothetical protein